MVVHVAQTFSLQISYMVFLGFFSFFLMTDLYPVSDGNTPSVYEYIVWGWAATMFLEEIRQVSLSQTEANVSSA